MSDETKTYILLPGKDFDGIINGERRTFVPGERVPLSEGQFQSFKDRFTDSQDVYDAAALKVKPAEPEEPEEIPAPAPAPKAESKPEGVSGTPAADAKK